VSSKSGLAAVQPPRGSIRRSRKEQRPSEIINAAFEEFSKRGYEAARLEDVADRVGVTKGTIYFYFKDKRELFKAVVQKFIQPIFRQVAGLDSNYEGTTQELMHDQLKVIYRELVRNRRANQLMRLIIAEGPQFPELPEVYYREIVRHGIEVLRHVIERGVARGEFRRSRISEFPQLLFAPVMTAVIWNLLFNRLKPLDLDRYSEAHLDLLLNGLNAIRLE